MKLYEFSVTDEFNLPKSEIIRVAERTAAEESAAEGWTDFKVVECKDSERLTSGECRYFFEVVGAFAASTPDDKTDRRVKPSRGSGDVAAAPSLD